MGPLLLPLSWREVNGPKALEGALHTLAFPLDTAVPLLPGQAWPFSSDRFLAESSTITEILFTNLSPTACGDTHAHCPVSTMATPSQSGPSFPTRRGLKCTTALWRRTTGSKRSLVRLMPARLSLLWSPPTDTQSRLELPLELFPLLGRPLPYCRCDTEIYRLVLFLPPSYMGHLGPATQRHIPAKTSLKSKTALITNRENIFNSTSCVK